MEILYGPDFNIKEDTVVTIGKFDGLHLGHKKVLAEVVNQAQKSNLKSVVYTFFKNPKLVLHQDEFIPIMTNEEKSEAIGKLNIDYLVYEQFDEKFSGMEPEDFVKKVILDKINAKIVVMGKNSTFGKDRVGNIEVMKELGKKYGFNVISIDMVLANGEVISSSRIRMYK